MKALWQHTFALAFLQFPQALSVTDAGALRFLPEAVRGRVCLSDDGSVLVGSVGPVCWTSSIEWTECTEEVSVLSVSIPRTNDDCQGNT